MFTLNCNGRLLVVDKPILMGVINITPDSFYSGSRHDQPEAVLHQAERMLKEGATIIDIGGQSTRPGSTPISADEELHRVIRPVELLHKKFPEAIISIDTWQAVVAKEAVGAGASIINDISAGSIDSAMISTVASLRVPYILMHMQGKPENMQKNPQYSNVTTQVLDFFIQQIAMLRKKGINDIIIDPGFGFGKTIAHNFELLRNLSVFAILDCPLMLGISRKSTISKTLVVTTDDALNGTTVLNTIGLMNGVDILRVHDVREAAEAIKLFEAYKI